MKNKTIGKCVVTALLAVTSVLVIKAITPYQNHSVGVYAESASPVLPDQGLAVSEAVVGSELYHALCLNLKQEGESAPTILYTNSFYNAGITHLNLSIAKLFPGTSPTYKNGLSGLKEFNLTGIQSIDLSSSKLNSFQASDIVPEGVVWQNLTAIDLSNNELSSVQFGGSMTSLSDINLTNNQITKVEAKSLSPTKSGNKASIYLANNNIEDIAQIELPYLWEGTPTITVEVTGNALKEKPTSTEKRIFKTGLQNLSKSLFVSGESIAYEQIENVKAYVFQVKKEDDKEVLTEYKVLSNDEVFSLPVDRYRVKFFDITLGVFLEDEKEQRGLIGYDFTIKPTTPTYKIIVGNKEYDQYDKTINGRPKVTVSGGQGTIYYSVAGGEWKEAKEGESISLKNFSGKYIVRLKNVENGIESQIVSISLSTSLNPYLPDLLLLVIIIGIILLIGFVGYPLLKKYVIR